MGLVEHIKALGFTITSINVLSCLFLFIGSSKNKVQYRIYSFSKSLVILMDEIGYFQAKTDFLDVCNRALPLCANKYPRY